MIFQIELKCNEKKFPFVPRKFYHQARPEFDQSWWGAAGDEFIYGDHVFVRKSRNKMDNKLFETVNDKITYNERAGDSRNIVIERTNAGYWIMATAILNKDWAGLRALLTRFVPPPPETIAKNPGWGHFLTQGMKDAFVMRACGVLKTIFLHIHSLAEKIWDCKKHCPNMEFDELWKVFKKANKYDWFYFGCLITEYSSKHGYFDGTKFSFGQFVKTFFTFVFIFQVFIV